MILNFEFPHLKKIFITIPWFHPAYKAGGPVQSIANMVNELREGYEFYIFTSNQDLDGLPMHITQIEEWVQYNAHTKVWYATKLNQSRNLTEEVERIRPDCLYMVGLYDWHFTMVPLFFTKVPQKILSVRGMLHPGALGEKALKKRLFLQMMKWFGLPKKCGFHVTDATEGGYVKAIFGQHIIMHEAGNFSRRMEVLQLPVKEPGSLRLVSIALLSAMKNILPVLQTLEHCRGEILYDIYGPVKDIGYWEQCLQQIKLLPANVRVQYHKDVTPAEVPQKLSHAHVFILPSKSENFGHAIYEALSAGLPVITSDHTPWNGLEEAQAGLNVTTDVEGLKPAIDFFAEMDNETFLQWHSGALRYAAVHLDVEGLKGAYGKMF